MLRPFLILPAQRSAGPIRNSPDAKGCPVSGFRGRWASEEGQRDVLLDAELQDARQLASILDVLLEY